MSSMMTDERTALPTTMRAIVRDGYGEPGILRLEEVPVPELADDGVLVRVHAASVNRGDFYILTGTPFVARAMVGVRRPKDRFVGTDFAGVVEAAGKDVTHVRVGDEVFGGRNGAFADYVSVRVGVVKKPANVTFEEAAAVPVAGLTALQGLRDHGRLEAGQRVLVNGASGGVGTMAVQIAKALGAHVTAVCSPRNVEQARALGADRVIDYTREDFTRTGERYDQIFDNAGNRGWLACRRVLEKDGVFVLVGGRKVPVVGPLGHVALVSVGARLTRREAHFFIAKFNRTDLDVLRTMLENGTLKPAVERTYPLGEAAAALRYMGEGHARGKLVLTV